MRFFTARLGSLADAEDLIQDLFLRVSAIDRDAVAGARAEGARAEGARADVSSAMLYRIAQNLMIDRMRSRTRGSARDEQWRRDNSHVLAGETVADEPPADDVVASRQRLEQLSRAVSGLPANIGRAFRLHKLEGMSHAETAAAMGISKSAVEKHISAAMKLLMKRLK